MRQPAAVYRDPVRSIPPAYRGGRGQPSLTQFVVLSMALHALFIMMFGAPSGGSREGRAMWGSLDVVIATPRALPTPSLKIDRGLGKEAPPVAPSDDKKSAGTRETKAAPPRPVDAPAAPLPSPVHLSPTKDITPPRVAPEGPIDAPAMVPAPPPEPRAEPLPVQPLFVPPAPIEKVKSQELKTEILPTVKIPLDEPPALPATTPPPPAPPPQVERPMAPRVEVAPAEAPPVPAPIVQPVTPPAPIEQVPSPPVERKPMEVPAVPVPPLEAVVPPKIEPTPTAPEVSRPRERPSPTAPVEDRVEPAAPAATAPAPAATPAPEKVESRPIERDAPGRSEPALRAPAVAPPERSGDSIFRTPRDAVPGAGPGLDLDAARRRARELAREGTGNRAVLPFPMPPLPEHKTKEQLAIEKARKPDCKTAYKDLGLLAVVPLVANEFGEGTCRW